MSEDRFFQKSDKLYWHRYIDFYEPFLVEIENRRNLNILEFGTADGDSARWLLERFPNAVIYSADILPRQENWPEDPRLHYLELDQGDVGGVAAALEKCNVMFDLIIEDGSHIPSHQTNSLTASLSLMRSGGFYIVEDLHTSYEQLPRGIRYLRASRPPLWEALRGIFASLRQGSGSFGKFSGVNLLSYLLAKERSVALGSKNELSSLPQHQLGSMVSSSLIDELDAKISKVTFYRRLGLPLACFACKSDLFDLVGLVCECGQPLLRAEDSMSAVLQIV